MTKNISAAALLALSCQLSYASQDIQPKVIGGQTASSNWHSLVALIDENWVAQAATAGHQYPVGDGQFCGGTLLGKHWVLTAAHCLFDSNEQPLPAYDIELLIGSQTLDVPQTSSLLHDVSRIKVHPSYDSQSENNDIALLKLEDAVDTSQPGINTIVLPDNKDWASLTLSPDYDDILSTLGWGIADYDGSRDNPIWYLGLQEVGLDYLPFAGCQSLYDDLGSLSDHMICAYEPEPDATDTYGEDSCQGDSGGPLFFTDDPLDDSPQVGIVSFGRDCGDASRPGVYTDVIDYINWIEFTTRLEGYPIYDLKPSVNNTVYRGNQAMNFKVAVSNNSTANDVSALAITFSHPDDIVITNSNTDFACTDLSNTETLCQAESIPPIDHGDIVAFPFKAEDLGGRTDETVTVTYSVNPLGNTDYRRTNNGGGEVQLLFTSKPDLALSATAICMDRTVEQNTIRFSTELSNRSESEPSLDTILTFNIDSGISLQESTLPENCSRSSDSSGECDLGTIDANSSDKITLTAAAAPGDSGQINATITNSNGSYPDAEPAADINLDFSRDDLPACSSMSGGSNSSSASAKDSDGGSGGGGGGSFNMLLLMLMFAQGLLRKHRR